MNNLFETVKGICLVPEGRISKDCKAEGYPYEVSSIQNLDEILDFAKRKHLLLLYLMTKNGLSYADDRVQAPNPKSRMTERACKAWAAILSEEIVRVCVENQTNLVYFMTRFRHHSQSGLSIMCDMLSHRGIDVRYPIAGLSSDKAIFMLRMC